MTGGRRFLSRRQLEFIALGGTVGSGLFVGMAQGIHMAGPALLVAYAVAGLMVFVIARCLADMVLSGRQSLPLLEYTRRYLGPRAAFVQGWSYWICAMLIAMAELTAVGLLVRSMAPSLAPWAIASAGLAAIFVINRLSVRTFGEIEFWMALLKIAAIVLFLLAGLFLLARTAWTPGQSVFAAQSWRHGLLPAGLAGLLPVLPTALFAFGGVELIGVAAADMADPWRTVPRATNQVLLRLVIFYLGTTAMVLCLMPWQDVAPDSSPMVAVFNRVGIRSAGTIMNLVLISAILSACNSTLYAASRILRMLAGIGAAPAVLARSNEAGTPVPALLLSTAAVSGAVLLNYLLPAQLFQLLLGMAVLVGLTNWMIFLVAHLRFRRTPDASSGRPFPSPLAPWTNYMTLFLIAIVMLLCLQDAGMRIACIVAVSIFAGLLGIQRLVGDRTRRAGIE